MEYRTILTDGGLAAIAAAAQAGAQAKITHLAMGDGGGAEYMPDSAQTSLKNERWRGAVASYTRDGNRFTVTAHMPAETEAFVVRELALFLEDGTCFAVANAPSIPHQPPVGGVGTEFETIMPFVVDNADSVTVVVDPTGGIPWSMVGQPNGVAGLDETGKVPMSQLPELDFDAAGSAAAVQANLTAHTGNRGNPHGVTAAQVGAFSKEQTLTAATAALVGLGAAATPDQVFAKLKGLLDAAGSHADTKAQIEVKSYIGTGTYGVSNPCSLTFSFVPEVVLFLVRRRSTEVTPASFYNDSMSVMIPSILTTSYGVSGTGFCVNSYSDGYGKKSPDGRTIYWYANSAANQLNPNGYEFIFVGIGK